MTREEAVVILKETLVDASHYVCHQDEDYNERNMAALEILTAPEQRLFTKKNRKRRCPKRETYKQRSARSGFKDDTMHNLSISLAILSANLRRQPEEAARLEKMYRPRKSQQGNMCIPAPQLIGVGVEEVQP